MPTHDPTTPFWSPEGREIINSLEFVDPAGVGYDGYGSSIFHFLYDYPGSEPILRDWDLFNFHVDRFEALLTGALPSEWC